MLISFLDPNKTCITKYPLLVTVQQLIGDPNVTRIVKWTPKFGQVPKL